MFFGNIENGKMALNDIGRIITAEWMKTEKIRQNARLDEWVIMPNHFHGIIVIEYQIPTPVPASVVDAPFVVDAPRVVVETPRRGVSTASSASSTAANTNKTCG